MLTAIVNGKGRRVRSPDSDVTVSWRDLFKQYEDLLTGAFFGRIRYLSEPMFTLVLEQLIGPTHTLTAGKLMDFEFWPNLTGLEGRSHVQPDVLINFENATVLVEVKPPFGQRQSVSQWQEQLNAFLAECRDLRRVAPPLVHYVALGRNTPSKDEIPFDHLHLGEAAELLDLAIHRLEWEDIVASVSAWLVDGRRGDLQASGADIAVLEDLEECFRLFGIKRRTLLPWSGLSDWMVGHALLLPDVSLGYPRIAAITPAEHDYRDDWAGLATYPNRNPWKSHDEH